MTLVESGVAWLGEVPSNWAVKPAKALFTSPSEPSLPNDVHLTPSQKYGVLPQSEYMETTGSRVVLNLTGADNMKHVKAGDFVSHLRSFQGGLEFSGLDGKISNAYTVLRPRTELAHGFYRWLFKSSLYVQGLQTTTDQLRDGQSIRFAQFALLPLPEPPIEQQRAIAAFLDRETAQIDNLIAKQGQLIATLGERKLSLISIAVSGASSHEPRWKNNDPNWASLPKSWELLALKRVLEIPMTDGPHETPDFLDEGVEFISAEAVASGEINFESRRGFISPEEHARFSQKYKPRLHDIYVVKSGATTGRCAILRESRDFNIWSPLAVVRCASRVDPFFVHYVIQSRQFQQSISLSWTFGTQQNIGMGTLQNLKVPLPSIDVQLEIVRDLDEKLSVIGRLVTLAQSQRALLAERRQALISAAVTGKIDVRG